MGGNNFGITRYMCVLAQTYSKVYGCVVCNDGVTKMPARDGRGELSRMLEQQRQQKREQQRAAHNSSNKLNVVSRHAHRARRLVHAL